jgi:PST family polysaccharide transporter
MLSGGMGLAIQIVATVVLARLLSPADFGVVAMVTTISLVLANFGLNGFTEAVLQRQEMDHALASNLFWINLGVGLFLTIGFAAAGSLLARFYHDPVVAHVAIGVSPTIFVTSTLVMHLALLKRGMRFSVTSANDVASRLFSVLVSIVVAWAGRGYWALVAGLLAQVLAQSIGAWLMCRWIPGLPRRVAGTGSMILFAIRVYGRFGVNYFTWNVDNLLVGWRFGAHSMGLYKKAYDLFALPTAQLTAPLTNVAVSALSRFEPRSIEYRRLLLGALAVLAFIGMGLGANFTLVGNDLIRLVLGPKWAPAGRIFVFFGPGIGVMLLYYTNGWIHLSIGRPDRWFRWGLVEASVTCLLFLIGLPWGPVGIAAAWTVSFWILTVPAISYAGRPIGLKVTPVLAVVWRYVVASLLAGCATAGIMRGLPTSGQTPGAAAMFAHIAVISLLFGALYLGTVMLLHRGWAPIYQVARLLREMLPWDSVSGLAQAVAATCDNDTPGASISKSDSMKPLVSILIPAYNAQKWIAQTLRSAIAQTWEPKEIIVVDDGSTDQTPEIARQFELDGVRVIKQKNQGAAAARNKAFSLSRGDYIQWLDADDVLAPDKIARQMEAAVQCHSKQTLFSSPWGLFMHRLHRAEFVPTPLWRDLPPVEWLLHKMGENLYMQTATWLISRELTKAAGPWDTRLLSDDDGEYFSRVLLASDGVRFVPDAKVYYRGPGLAFRSLSYIGRSDRKIDAHWLSMRLHIGYLRSLEDSERVRVACLRYLQACLIYFYPERPDIVQQAEQTAKDLARQLALPDMPLMYTWIKTFFGWRAAKHCQQLLPRIRWSIQKTWDAAIFRIEKRSVTATSLTTKQLQNGGSSPAPALLDLGEPGLVLSPVSQRNGEINEQPH